MIEVEVKVVGLFDAESVSVAKRVSVKPNARPADAIGALYKTGGITRHVYKKIKRLRAPFFLVLNDVKQEGKPRSITLRDGDCLTVLQMSMGG